MSLWVTAVDLYSMYTDERARMPDYIHMDDVWCTYAPSVQIEGKQHKGEQAHTAALAQLRTFSKRCIAAGTRGGGGH